MNKLITIEIELKDTTTMFAVKKIIGHRDFCFDDGFTKRFHPILEEAITYKLASHGWSLEPYDAGTMHAYN